MTPYHVALYCAKSHCMTPYHVALHRAKFHLIGQNPLLYRSRRVASRHSKPSPTALRRTATLRNALLRHTSGHPISKQLTTLRHELLLDSPPF